MAWHGMAWLVKCITRELLGSHLHHGVERFLSSIACGRYRCMIGRRQVPRSFGMGNGYVFQSLLSVTRMQTESDRPEVLKVWRARRWQDWIVDACMHEH